MNDPHNDPHHETLFGLSKPFTLQTIVGNIPAPVGIPKEFGFYFAKLNAEYEFPSGEIQTRAYQDPLGYATGPGGVRFYPDGSPIREGDTWTTQEALALYAHSVRQYAEELADLLPKGLNLNQFQFDGLGVMFWNNGPQLMKGQIARALELDPPRIAQAVNVFSQYRRGTMWGGSNGPDGTPVRVPTTGTLPPGLAPGQVMPAGMSWFKAMRGIYRRSCAAACLALGLDWEEACAYDRIRMVSTPEWRPDENRWVDVVHDQTAWKDILDVARQYPLKPVEIVPRDVPAAAPEPAQERIEVTAPVVEEALPEIAPAPSAKPKKPYEQYDPNAPEKSIAESRRGWAFVGIVMGWFGTLSAAIAEMFAGMPWVEKVAAMSPLEVKPDRWWVAVIILMCGFALYRHGQVKAKGPIK